MCPLSSYLELLEVLLLHLLLCYNERLVLNLVDLLGGAVRLNLRHYLRRRDNLREGSFDVALLLQLLARRQNVAPLGREASLSASEQALFYFA